MMNMKIIKPYKYGSGLLLLLLLLTGTAAYSQTINGYTVDEGNAASMGSANVNTAITASNVTVERHGALSIIKNAAINLSNVTAETETELTAVSSGKIRITGSFHIKAGAEGWLAAISDYFTAVCPIGARTATMPADEPIAELEAADGLPEAITVYPNPFTAELTIVFEAGQAQPVQFALYDLLGNQLAVQQYDGSHSEVNGRGVMKYDGSQLPAGVYLYQVQLGETVQSGRIMKQ